MVICNRDLRHCSDNGKKHHRQKPPKQALHITCNEISNSVTASIIHAKTSELEGLTGAAKMHRPIFRSPRPFNLRLIAAYRVNSGLIADRIPRTLRRFYRNLTVTPCGWHASRFEEPECDDQSYFRVSLKVKIQLISIYFKVLSKISRVKPCPVSHYQMQTGRPTGRPTSRFYCETQAALARFLST